MNFACKTNDCIWQIIKYPHENCYTALVTPKDGDIGACVVKADHIDDLIEKVIAETQRF